MSGRITTIPGIAKHATVENVAERTRGGETIESTPVAYLAHEIDTRRAAGYRGYYYGA